MGVLNWQFHGILIEHVKFVKNDEPDDEDMFNEQHFTRNSFLTSI